LFSVFRWVGLAYAGSASVACLLYFSWRDHGVGVLLVMLPLLVMLLVTLHLYFRQQEAGLVMAERETQAAARHLRDPLFRSLVRFPDRACRQ
jgi:hypothetical protein